MNIEEKINKLGDKFRGLWRLNELIPPSYANFTVKWYVTFVFKGEYVETFPCNSIDDALEHAIKFSDSE